jgi:hypothetical protein
VGQESLDILGNTDASFIWHTLGFQFGNVHIEAVKHSPDWYTCYIKNRQVLNGFEGFPKELEYQGGGLQGDWFVFLAKRKG